MFKALILNKDADGQISASITEKDDSFLGDEGEVIVDIQFSGLNYKDGLCLNGKGGLIRSYPRIPGVEFSGIVAHSQSPHYQPGDKVIATGWRIGEVWHGGYAARARVKADWLVPLPAGMDCRQAMILGTPGITAMFALEALEAHGLNPQSGEMLVTGAAGGVGSVAVALLAACGYQVAAVTGRIDEAGSYLEGLGATRLIPRTELAQTISRPLESEQWAGCIDNVGGDMLGRVLGQMAYGASVAAVGNAGGLAVPANIIPFLLRGVNLLGIDSVMQPFERRLSSWQRLADQFPMEKLEIIVTEINLESLAQYGKAILKGQIQGRCLVCL